jgi:hypothetical protein
MNLQFMASFFDLVLSLILGLIATLYGFRILGEKSNESQKFDIWYDKWGKHLRWIGPGFMGFSVIWWFLKI